METKETKKRAHSSAAKAPENKKTTVHASPKEPVVKDKEKEKVKEKKVAKSDGTRAGIPKESFYGTGKRKNAIAKVWVFKGSGEIVINHKPAGEYLTREVLTKIVLKPFELCGVQGKYDVFARALGGGLSGQADAVRLGIARALLIVNQTFRGTLKKEGLLTRDARIKERKKYGRKRARKGPQYRKR